MKRQMFNNKYIFESDADQSQMSNNASQSQNSDNSKVATIITGASVGIGGVTACLAYLYKTHGIKDWKGLSGWFKNAISQNEGGGWFGAFIKKILGSISSALTWANNLVKPLTAKVPYLSSPIAGSPFTYGSVMAMAVIAAAVGAVIYKVYKVIKNRKKPQETTEAFFVRQRFEMMTALNECDAMFNELTILTEYSTTYDKRKTLSELSFPSWISNLFVSYKGVSGEAISHAVSGNTEPLTKALNGGDSFIGKVWGSIQKLYSQVADIATNMPMLAKVVIVITALVACWFGVKKYLASKSKNADRQRNTNNAQNNTNNNNTNNNNTNNNNTNNNSANNNNTNNNNIN